MTIKVPVILQMEAAECGAASLAMVLAYHKRYIPLEKLRIQCGVSRDGSNAMNIVRAAQHNGLIARAYKKEPEELKKMTFPAILHWNFNHFVVLCGFSGEKAIINDPASGTRKIEKDELDSAFTGIVLCFERGENFEPCGKKTSVTRFLKTALTGSKSTFVYLILLGFVVAMVGLVTPVFSRLYIDRVLVLGDSAFLVSLIFAMVLALLILALTLFLEGKYLIKLKAKLAVAANANFFWHILHLPVTFFGARYSGDLIGRQVSNELMAELLCSKIAPVVINCSMILFYLVVMIKYDLALSFMAALVAMLNIGLLLYSGKKRENLTRKKNRNEGQYSGVLASGIEMIETIKASAAEEGTFEKWIGYGSKYLNSRAESDKAEVFMSEIPGLLMSLLNALILFMGIFKILNGQFTIGMLIAFQGFLLAFLTPVNEITAVGDNMQEFKGHIERIDDVMKSKTEENIGGSEMMLSGSIEIKNLRFSYNPLTFEFINNFNLTVQPRQTVALVGNTGSGKSTIAKLIGGLFVQQEGEILFDGLEKSNISSESFYKSVAMVDQDITMFEGTVFDNITMWDSKVPFEDVLSAAKDAGIHSNIMERPGGYNARVTEGGRNFSGGERQRIEIARALVKKPQILILDEATSALDTKTEFEVTKAIKDRGITLIIVAHRLSTIRDADEIIVMDRGKAVESGTHSQLMAINKIYAKLILISL